MTNHEPKSRVGHLTNRAHPGAPRNFLKRIGSLQFSLPQIFIFRSDTQQAENIWIILNAVKRVLRYIYTVTYLLLKVSLYGYRSQGKEGNPDICNSMNGPGGITQSEISQREANIVGSHLYVESKTAELTETEESDATGANGKIPVKEYKLLVTR